MCCNFLTLELRFYKIGSKIYTGGIASTTGFCSQAWKKLPSTQQQNFSSYYEGSRYDKQDRTEWSERVDGERLPSVNGTEATCLKARLMQLITLGKTELTI
jgi:hypothetical protein